MTEHHNVAQPSASASTPTSRRTRRERPVTYQLDLSQRRNSDDEIAKPSPRPQLHRAPRSSPVILTRQSLANGGEALGANAVDKNRETYSSTVSHTPTFLPRLSFGTDISPLGNIFNDTSSSPAREKPLLRRTAKMSNSQHFRQTTRHTPSEATDVRIAIIRQDVPLQVVTKPSASRRLSDKLPQLHLKRHHVVDNKSYRVSYDQNSVRDILSDKVLLCGPRSASDPKHINGILYLYDARTSDVLLSLPGLLDILQPAGVPVVLASIHETPRSVEMESNEAAIEEQCDLVRGEMEIFHFTSSPDVMEDGFVQFLLGQIDRPFEELDDGSSDDDLLASVSLSGHPLSTIGSRNDSKLSHRVRSDTHHPTEKSLSINTWPATNSDAPPVTYSNQEIVKPLSEVPASLETLVNRIFVGLSSRADEKFTTTFFAVYRLFATPSELLEQMLALYAAQPAGTQNKQKDAFQARLIAVIHFWVLAYPGDFATGPVKEILRNYLSGFAYNDPFQARRQQIDQTLDTVCHNDDTRWACSDEAAPDTAESISGNARRVSNPDTQSPESSGRSTNTRSRMTGSSLQRQSSSPLMKVPASLDFLAKSHWRLFMELPEDVIAQSIAIIDRRLFVAAQPRDFLRQVTVSAKKRPLYRTLKHVAALTSHFNRLAQWVASLILVRDKAKDRVLAFEKIIRVARVVRQLNDYNALGALVAGIHNTAVHRLAATRDLLNKDTAKDFARLEILMSTAKGHAAYRLAWENTTIKGRVPYMPVVLSDLVAADSSGPIFIDRFQKDAMMSPVSISSNDGNSRLINWHKFARMGEVIHVLESAQASIEKHMADEATLNETVRSLLLETAVDDDDELYARSCAVEPPASPYQGSGNDGKQRRRFMDRLISIGSID